MAPPKKGAKKEAPEVSTDDVKGIDSALKVIDDMNPYASYLEDNTLSNVSEFIDTGSMVLNALISARLDGGIPQGRLTLLSAESMCGKSYICQRLGANAQKKGKVVVIFDTENAIDADGARRLGLDPAKVKYVPTLSIEQCRNTLFQFLTDIKNRGLEGKFFIIIDSLGNLDSELQFKRMTDDNMAADMGTRAKAIKSMLRTATQMAALTNTTIVATNHVYADVGAMYESIVKSQSGGSGVIYLPSVTVQLARRNLKEEDALKISNDANLAAGQKNFSGVILRALTVKNRFAKQFLEAEMFLSFSHGLHKYYGLETLLREFDVIETKGETSASGYIIKKTGKEIGKYSKWSADESVWAELLPLLQTEITKHWTYGSVDETDRVLPDNSATDNAE